MFERCLGDCQFNVTGADHVEEVLWVVGVGELHDDGRMGGAELSDERTGGVGGESAEAAERVSSGIQPRGRP